MHILIIRTNFLKGKQEYQWWILFKLSYNLIIKLEVGIYLANDYGLPYFKNILNLKLLF